MNTIDQEQFVHLHNHSEYSLLDGYGHVKDMVARAAELGQPAMALTDHGNLHAAIDFYQSAKDAGISPIIGMEGYVAFGSRHDRSPNEGSRGGSQPHITLLAEDLAGYKNLLVLSTKAHLEGFYYRPRLDRELLEQHNAGIIVLSGCLSGELARDVLKYEGDLTAARKTAAWYREVFGDRYYLELMHHEHVPGQELVNRAVHELGRELGIETVVTNDCHYVYPEDAPHQDVLTCIITNSKLADAKRLRMEDQSYYVKSAAEMARLFPEHPQALRNTLAIAERCNAELEQGNTIIPQYPTPGGISASQYLRQICMDGARMRYGEPSSQALERLEKELRIIEVTDFADYFLVVWDIFKFVKENGILSTVRGSAASSLVLYCLQVTDFDPQPYSLFFERFLNIERREMPDIDMEFADDRRAEVIQYCVRRFGTDRVAQITTFGTMRTRAAIRDAARVMEDGDLDNAELSAACGRLLRIATESAWAPSNSDDEDEAPREEGLAGIYRESAEMQRLCNDNHIAKQILERAQGIEGRVRNVGTHAAGVVISDKPLVEYVPLQKPAQAKDDDIQVAATQYSMYPLEQVGLLKMDFLGLTNLAALDRCIKIIAAAGGPEIDLYDLPLDDPKTFELMGDGDTFGSFQLEGSGMTRYIKELKPSSINDIAAMIALYRPGPMQHIDRFISCKHGRTEITYPHPSIKHLLEETYGVIVYQDQVMLAAQDFAGYTLGEADILRKAMGKKVPEIMREEERKFVAGAVRKGHSEQEGRELFAYILPFAGYGFNKAHAVSYAYITYWTTYFKAHYPIEYSVAMLESFADAPERVRQCVLDAKRRDIRILPPDINVSNASFTVDRSADEEGRIRYGLAAVKGVGPAAVKQITDIRDSIPGKRFSDMAGFCDQMAETIPSESVMRALIMAGAFDSLAPRQSLLDNLEKMLSHMRTVGTARSAGQHSMFANADVGEAYLGIDFGAPQPNGGISLAQKQEWERELFGLVITEDPRETALRDAIHKEKSGAIVFASSENLLEEGRSVRVIGKIVSVERRSTRNGNPFVSATLVMLDGEIGITAWSQTLKKTEALWQEDVYILAKGSVRIFNGQTNIDISSAEAYAPGPKRLSPSRKAVASSRIADEKAKYQSRTNGSTSSNGSRRGNRAQDVNASPQGERMDIKNQGDEDTAIAVKLRFSSQDEKTVSRELLHRVILALYSHQGQCRVIAEIDVQGKTVAMDFPFFKVSPSENLKSQLAEIIGSENVFVPHLEAGIDA